MEDFVLEKSIFNNIFEKDIRRVFIYKKAERLAKAISLISPAFEGNSSLRDRIGVLTMSLIDAAMLPPIQTRAVLSRELLSLSSVLSMARISGILSPMNADIISHEAHALLKEIALYEEPRLLLDEPMTLSEIAKNTSKKEAAKTSSPKRVLQRRNPPASHADDKGHIKDTEGAEHTQIKDRREAVLSVIKNKGKASIKDISTLIRGVSEKTIQRELSALVSAGIVLRQGERRWSTYSLSLAGA
ncbi:MAG: DeoR family transcriptional regulator [Patescibacteria group bacterium]|nr:DeoR family transcriptional regulator [Patescibacteria group bacterium]